ncbi:hypothetical protein [Mesorhizobium sp. INR15]|nr:hypothetical protein [Mesorhizobium sp. INR15]
MSIGLLEGRSSTMKTIITAGAAVSLRGRAPAPEAVVVLTKTA